MFPVNFQFRLIRRMKRDFVKLIKWVCDLFKIHEAPALFQTYMRLWRDSGLLRRFLRKHELREIADYLQVDNPLKKSQTQEISLAVLCHPKDLDLLKVCINGAISNIEDDLIQVIIVSPVPVDVSQFNFGIPTINLLDSDLISTDLIEKIKSRFGSEQFSWVLQQVLKIQVALKLDSECTLILDSDTVLVSPRRYSGGLVQLLAISYEYHSLYVSHYKKFKPAHQELGVSFVTHHQLWQRDIVNLIWGGSGLNDWLDLADPTHPNSISEYHTYGTFLVNENPNRVAWARWGNKPISKSSVSLNSNGLDRLFASKKGRPNSFSIHSYS